ncbi:MAG: hypothetical protein BAA01_01555 [Bacillus thermozeamaize]|uniref:Tripartite ATP-independent periplasmic transporters DctQ component domain-containing protein n=1 Tax=Bacillus thermozeamaize TaxID=230954 RepID=A0A1Y3PFE0_9BACI|nr:MAG: hypothetical protein BAA01_01555 [Bacillus thermozeamaize]
MNTNNGLPFNGKISRIVDKIEVFLTAFLLSFITLLVFFSVVARKLLGYSSGVIEESVRFAMIWMVFVAGSLAFKRDMHITINILVDKLSEKKKLFLQTFACLLGFLFCVFLVVKGLELVISSYQLDERSIASWKFPLWIPRLAVPVGALLMAFRLLERMLQNLVMLRQVK